MGYTRGRFKRWRKFWLIILIYYYRSLIKTVISCVNAYTFVKLLNKNNIFVAGTTVKIPKKTENKVYRPTRDTQEDDLNNEENSG